MDYFISLYLYYMRFIITENKLKDILHKLLNSVFTGFDDIHYGWANFNCGMGECCDPYAVGFVLPKNNYDDYLFKLVDGENYDNNGDYPNEISEDLPEVCYESPNIENPDFNTIIFYDVFAEEIEQFIGPKDKWKSTLLELLNEKFNMNATNILFL